MCAHCFCVRFVVCNPMLKWPCVETKIHLAPASTGGSHRHHSCRGVGVWEVARLEAWQQGTRAKDRDRRVEAGSKPACGTYPFGAQEASCPTRKGSNHMVPECEIAEVECDVSVDQLTSQQCPVDRDHVLDVWPARHSAPNLHRRAKPKYVITICVSDCKCLVRPGHQHSKFHLAVLLLLCSEGRDWRLLLAPPPPPLLLSPARICTLRCLNSYNLTLPMCWIANSRAIIQEGSARPRAMKRPSDEKVTMRSCKAVKK